MSFVDPLQATGPPSAVKKRERGEYPEEALAEVHAGPSRSKSARVVQKRERGEYPEEALAEVHAGPSRSKSARVVQKRERGEYAEEALAEVHTGPSGSTKGSNDGGKVAENVVNISSTALAGDSEDPLQATESFRVLQKRERGEYPEEALAEVHAGPSRSKSARVVQKRERGEYPEEALAEVHARPSRSKSARVVQKRERGEYAEEALAEVHTGPSGSTKGSNDGGKVAENVVNISSTALAGDSEDPLQATESFRVLQKRERGEYPEEALAEVHAGPSRSKSARVVQKRERGEYPEEALAEVHARPSRSKSARVVQKRERGEYAEEALAEVHTGPSGSTKGSNDGGKVAENVVNISSTALAGDSEDPSPDNVDEISESTVLQTGLPVMRNPFDVDLQEEISHYFASPPSWDESSGNSNTSAEEMIVLYSPECGKYSEEAHSEVHAGPSGSTKGSNDGGKVAENVVNIPWTALAGDSEDPLQATESFRVLQKRERGEYPEEALAEVHAGPSRSKSARVVQKRERGEYPEEALAEVHARPSRSKSARVVQKRERGEYAEEALAEVHAGPSGSTKGSNDGGKVAENVVNISSTALAGDSEDPLQATESFRVLQKRERGEYPEEALAEVHAGPSRSKSARVVQKRERGEYAEEALAEVHAGPSGSTKGSNDGGKVAENVVNISSTALAGDSEDPLQATESFRVLQKRERGEYPEEALAEVHAGPSRSKSARVVQKRERGEYPEEALAEVHARPSRSKSARVVQKRERGEYAEEALAEVHARPSRSKSARVVQKRERGEYAEEALAEVHAGPSGSTKGSNDGGKVAENVVNISSTALAGDSEDPSPDNVDEISESTVLQTGLPVMRNPFDVDLQEEISHHFASPPSWDESSGNSNTTAEEMIVLYSPPPQFADNNMRDEDLFQSPSISPLPQPDCYLSESNDADNSQSILPSSTPESADYDFSSSNCSNLAQSSVTKPSIRKRKSVKAESVRKKLLYGLEKQDASQNLSKPKVRLRRRDPKAHKDSIKKMAKNAGLQYTKRDGSIVPAKEMKQGCEPTCRKKCSQRVTLNDRRKNFESFWECGSAVRQWEFIVSHCTSSKPQFTKNDATKHWKTSRKYFLLASESDKRIEVCLKMFVDTLSISHQMVKTAFSKIDPESFLIEEDQRGKFERQIRQDWEATKKSVIDHINSFPRVESHYVRENSTKEYLEEGLSVAQMHKMYLEVMDNSSDDQVVRASLRQYRDVFNANFNLAFHVPKKDACDACTSFNNCSASEKEIRRNDHMAHLQEKSIAREIKNENKKAARESDNICAAVFDYEKILNAPSNHASALYYKRKLGVFNFTIYDLGTQNACCYVYDETQGKKGGSEVASCLLNFIKSGISKGKSKFLFWSDNCPGQNKNTLVFGFYQLLAQEFSISIEHRFLVKGHTQNEGDSVHAAIERKTKNAAVHSPSHWREKIRSASEKGKYDVIEMTVHDFLNFESLRKNLLMVRNTTGTSVKWSQISEICISKDLPTIIRYRESFLENKEYIIDLEAGKKKKASAKMSLEDFSPTRSSPIPLKKDKYKDLMYLCEKLLIPTEYHSFYKNLPVE
ncbi:uncharacterized protein LOC129785944 isoform X2 [Lutzomyia longipalpis]|uniref:uncharacterized protein LOC129785944 isoform X2 n=1 Tax=Lutzomyia longipalpis TaxID=7200 RepID=UPI002484273F|nr:uncharacterized protein LOC129785944 isoform X2 [Lutzomyia longipalpis]